MAHIVIEYSAGLRGRLDLPTFLAAVHQAALATGVFPIGGIRTRAYQAEHYMIADGHPDNAFVHLSLKVGHGRDLETRKRACEAIFEAACRCLAPAFDAVPLGISLEMQDIDPVLTFKRNNLHDHVRRRNADDGARP
jgi:5-carboxymethyl-2-hydroxymuconate isomerase